MRRESHAAIMMFASERAKTWMQSTLPVAAGFAAHWAAVAFHHGRIIMVAEDRDWERGYRAGLNEGMSMFPWWTRP